MVGFRNMFKPALNADTGWATLNWARITEDFAKSRVSMNKLNLLIFDISLLSIIFTVAQFHWSDFDNRLKWFHTKSGNISSTCPPKHKVIRLLNCTEDGQILPSASIHPLLTIVFKRKDRRIDFWRIKGLDVKNGTGSIFSHSRENASGY